MTLLTMNNTYDKVLFYSFAPDRFKLSGTLKTIENIFNTFEICRSDEPAVL